MTTTSSTSALLLAAITLLAAPAQADTTLSLLPSWNLVSARSPIESVATIFADPQKFLSVWAWDSTKGSWQVALPGEEPAGQYAGGKGFADLTKIAAGDGFWVNSTSGQTLTLPGQPVDEATVVLGPGWNLKGLSSALPVNVPAVFAAMNKYASVWTWTAGGWSVFIPGEEPAGTYASAKGFANLNSIAPGEGFWANVNAGQDGTLTLPSTGVGATIGLAGGVVTAAANMASVAFVPRAVLADTTVTITPLGPESFPAAPSLVSGTVHALGPESLPLANRVELTLTYTPSALANGVTAEDLVLGVLVNGTWQPLPASRVDTATHTVQAPIHALGTYAVIDGTRSNSVKAYVVAAPAAVDEFDTVGAAAAYVCAHLQAGQQGGVVIKKSPVTVNTLTLSCDLEISSEDGSAISIEGSPVINTVAPASLVGLTFAGATTINTGADLLLAHNSFPALTVNPGAGASAALAKGMAAATPLASEPACFTGDTVLKNDTVVGPLTLSGGFKLCGDTDIIGGEASSLVANGGLEFTNTAHLEVNGSLIKTIDIEAKFSGKASTTLARLQGHTLSTLKLHVLDGEIGLNQLNYETEADLTIKTDGLGDLTINQDQVTIAGNHTADFADMGLETTTHWSASHLLNKGNTILKAGGTAAVNFADTTMAGTFEASLKANARELGINTVNTKYGLTARHTLYTDQAEQRLDLTVNGHASTTYEKGMQTCITTGAGARVEYTDSLVKNIVGSIGLGFSVIGKNSCTGGGLERPRNLPAGPQPTPTALSLTTDPEAKVMISHLTITDQGPSDEIPVGLEIKDLDLPVTVELNHIQSGFIGLLVKNITQPVTIANNTIDAEAGVSLASLAASTFTANTLTAPTGGLLIHADPMASPSILTHLTVSNNTLGSEGAIVGGPFGTAIVTITGNSLYSVDLIGTYMGLSGNTFTGGPGNGGITDAWGGLFIDPGHGNNSGIADELDISTDIDWTGNGCIDYPPSLDYKDEGGECANGDGISPPVLPLAP